MAIDNLIPTTELEAVNAMLAINGTSPVADLDAPLGADVEMALNLIRLVTKSVQSKGWHFNTDRLVELDPDGVTGKIAVPADTLRIKKSLIEEQRFLDIAHRHGFLWDRVDNTDVFVETVKVDVVRALDFEEMPEVARAYVFIVAGRRFQEQTIGNAELSGFGEKDETAALANLRDAEGLLEDTDYLDNFPDQQMVNKILADVSRQVQTEGWKFNTRLNVALEPEADDDADNPNALLVPEETIVARKSEIPQMAGFDLAHRGDRMYDVVHDTDLFTEDNSPTNGIFYLDLIVYLELDELPAVAFKYIKIKAARQLQAQRNETQPQGNGYSDFDEAQAYRDLKRAEGRSEHFNFMRNMDSARAVFRTSYFGKGKIRRGSFTQ